MARLLHLHFHLRSITKSNPSPILFFSTSNSNSNSNSNSPFNSLFEDIRNNLKHQPQPSNPNPNPNASTHQIRINLSEFRNRTAPPPPPPPPPQDLPQNHQISLQDIYQRKMGQTTTNSGGASSFNVQLIRESLQNISGKTPTSPLRRRSPQSESVFTKEMRKDGPASPSSSAATAFLKTYGVEDLGKKLKMLRPEGKGKDWFSVRELSERLEKLRKMEEQNVTVFDELRVCLQEMDQSKQKDTNKASLQGISILSQLSGSPTFPLEPAKPHLVEKYFHPDNMSSAEKLKIELAKVRDEFKMSESDCGSARVQIAQLTTKIKHLSAALHKKDVHSRKGLVAMVQRRKRLLKYLRRTDWDSYCFVIAKLGLRDNPDHSYRARSTMAT